MTDLGYTGKARVTLEGKALVFTNYTIENVSVFAEASRWLTEGRGPVDPSARLTATTSHPSPPTQSLSVRRCWRTERTPEV